MSPIMSHDIPAGTAKNVVVVVALLFAVGRGLDLSHQTTPEAKYKLARWRSCQHLPTLWTFGLQEHNKSLKCSHVLFFARKLAN
jgi:hypothetical protein